MWRVFYLFERRDGSMSFPLALRLVLVALR
jgi:hypothetical protein